MRFIIDRWQRIGVRLYLALGLAVALTLVSGAVGVYYFEQSGDLNYQIQTETVPALEASWSAARETERLLNLGLGVVARPDSDFGVLEGEAVAIALERLNAALDGVHGIPNIVPIAQWVSDAAYDLVEVIDNLVVNQGELQIVNEDAAGYQARLAAASTDIGGAEAALPYRPLPHAIRRSFCGRLAQALSRRV